MFVDFFMMFALYICICLENMHVPGVRMHVSYVFDCF